HALPPARLPPATAAPPHLDLERLLAAGHPHGLAHAHRARGLGTLAADLDLAGIHRLAGQAAGPEETRCPQPHIQAYVFDDRRLMHGGRPVLAGTGTRLARG